MVTQEQIKVKSIPKEAEIRTESPTHSIEDIEDRNDNDDDDTTTYQVEAEISMHEIVDNPQWQ
eukprot:14074054-Ditylum_brightwellii.AAC.1